MAKLLKLRLGVAGDVQATQPNLNDCLETVLEHAGMLMGDICSALALALKQTGARRIDGLQHPGVKVAIENLTRNSQVTQQIFSKHLRSAVFERGGKEARDHQSLRFENIQLFEDAELNQSIEIARAQQEVELAVSDTLPPLDALMSTLLGWRTVQPGLNPLRPEIFVRALQACLQDTVASAETRESLITPASGLLGICLGKIYKELVEWLRTSGIEPAVPVGGKTNTGASLTTGSTVVDSVAKTLLTLDKLRRLLAGDFDSQGKVPGQGEFLHTMPASMVALQDMKQVDVMVQRLEQRGRQAPPPPPPVVRGKLRDKPATKPLGHQLGEEVVRLMVDNLAKDARLLLPLREKLQNFEPVLQSLGQSDSRFFSDRKHPARIFLDRITQRSLGYASVNEEGCHRFLDGVQAAMNELTDKPHSAEYFILAVEDLEGEWKHLDQALTLKREEAAITLVQAEQRNLLAQHLAVGYVQLFEGRDVPQFVADFLKSSWAQAVAHARLNAVDGSEDPFGYNALVQDLLWSIHVKSARRNRQALAEMVPGIVDKLREGLTHIDYPPELTERFFDGLVLIHESILEEGKPIPGAGVSGADDSPVDSLMPSLERDPLQPVDTAQATDPWEDALNAVAPPVVQAVSAAPEQFLTAENPMPWLADTEASEAGYLAQASVMPEDLSEPEYSSLSQPLPEPVIAELQTGAWVDLLTDGLWIRAQLTWASPHGTLFMFTSLTGTAHSMSKRTLDRLRAQGLVKVVSDRHLVDQAFDEVAKTAMKNSLRR
jgi:hypothetical protein